MAAAPDGAAIVELTLVPATSVEDGLRRFATQQGLQVGAARRLTISGLPAASAEFAAQAQQTPVRGLVIYVEHRERVYQLLGYTAAQRFGAHSGAIVAALESFAPVRDASVLNVQPNRIEIVRLDRAQTLTQFAQRFKPSVDVQQLAVINHVPDTSTRLAAGTLVKHVS